MSGCETPRELPIKKKNPESDKGLGLALKAQSPYNRNGGQEWRTQVSVRL